MRGAAAGRYLGSHPRANVSMMSMRPPQHGHGRESAGGSAASADLGSSGIASGFGGLDNDHAPAAARTNIPLFVFVTTIGAAALAARRGWVGEAEEPTGQYDVVGPVGVGEEAVVTDATWK